MAVANADSERMAMEKAKEKEKFADSLRSIFKLADKLGDGVLHKWEFDDAIQNPEVMAMFEKLDMDEQEVVTVYNILSDEDGVADYHEFLTAALKMKNSARTFDMIQVMHEQTRQMRAIELVHEGLEHISACCAIDRTAWNVKKAAWLKMQQIKKASLSSQALVSNDPAKQNLTALTKS